MMIYRTIPLKQSLQSQCTQIETKAAPPLAVTLTTNYLKTDFRFKFCFKKTQSVPAAGTSRV